MREEIWVEIMRTSATVVTFVLGFLLSNRQIAKKERLEAKKESFYEFYLPAKKKLFDELQLISLLAPNESQGKKEHLDSYMEAVLWLADIRHLASPKVNSLIVTCYRAADDYDAFMECYHKLIDAVGDEGQKFASELGYSYFLPSEFETSQYCLDDSGSRRKPHLEIVPKRK